MNKRILNFSKLPFGERLKVLMLFAIPLADVPHCGLLGSLYALGDQYVETMLDTSTGEIVHIGVADYLDLNKYCDHITLELDESIF